MSKNKLWASLLVSFLLFGCQPDKNISAAMPQPTISPTPQSMIEKILAEPQSFSGQQVTLEGTLEAEGQGLKVEFFLRAESGARLKVTPWAPLEVMRPPQGKSPARSMSFYVGRSLRLTGVIQSQAADVFLQVSSAEEP
ncbi:MAG: hypothetical protein OHK0031_01860 [Anaerolineales bacterium]